MIDKEIRDSLTEPYVQVLMKISYSLRPSQKAGTRWKKRKIELLNC